MNFSSRVVTVSQHVHLVSLTRVPSKMSCTNVVGGEADDDTADDGKEDDGKADRRASAASWSDAELSR